MVRPLVLGMMLWQAPDFPHRPDRGPGDDKRLPDGRSQTEAILKEEHKRTLKELDEMEKLLTDVRAELERNEHHVVSLGVLKKLEELEKKSKRIRDRMRR